MNVEPTLGLAFLAGLVSFISPCVLPLIPAYIGYMGGQATRAAGQAQEGVKFRTFLHGLAFVMGFTLFFVGFGLITQAASSFLSTIGIDIPTILTRLGGVAVLLFGLFVMGALNPVFRRGLELATRLRQRPVEALLFTLVAGGLLLAYYTWVFESILGAVIALLLTLALFKKPLETATSLGDFWYHAIAQLQMALMTDTRNISMDQSRSGYLGSLGMGTVFAAGWTPCIGPVYASILTLAATSGNDTSALVRSSVLLTAYSLGLGIPFLAAALALNQMSGVMRGLKRNMRKVELVSGTLLVIIGVLILSNTMAQIMRNFQSGEMGALSVRLEECTAGVGTGRLKLGSWADCAANGQPKLKNRLIVAAQKPDGLNAQAETPLFVTDPNFDPDSIEVGLEVGMRAPNFSTVTLEGEPVALEDLRGQVVLINFWATWCTPCKEEMPDFQRVYERFNPRGFTVLAVNFLEKPEQIEPFVEEYGLDFPIALDQEAEINDRYRVIAYPTSFIVDGNGVIIYAGPRALPGEDLVEILNGLAAGG